MGVSIPIESDAQGSGAYACSMPKTALGWGEKYRKAIKGKYTLAQIAEKLEMSESALRSWVNGNREINLSDFVRLCASSRLDPAALLASDTDSQEFLDIALAWRKARNKPIQREALLLAAKGILADESRTANGKADTG